MPGPRLQRAATVWPDLIQHHIQNRIFKFGPVYPTSHAQAVLPAAELEFPGQLKHAAEPELALYFPAGHNTADCLYAVTLCRGCSGTSASAWGPFWPPMPRPCLLLQQPPGEAGVGFT